jgi:hypothetical protein
MTGPLRCPLYGSCFWLYDVGRFLSHGAAALAYLPMAVRGAQMASGRRWQRIGLFLAVASTTPAWIEEATAAGVTLACKGTISTTGFNDQVTASVVIEGSAVHLSFVDAPCSVTKNTPNGVEFECAVSVFLAYISVAGSLDRLNGDLSVWLTKFPKGKEGKVVITSYDLTCKSATPLF